MRLLNEGKSQEKAKEDKPKKQAPQETGIIVAAGERKMSETVRQSSALSRKLHRISASNNTKQICNHRFF
jgi:hypothetical protein